MLPSRFVHAVLGILICGLTILAADDDAVRKTLDGAKAVHAKAIGDHKEAVEKWFGKEDDAARMLKTGVTEKVKQVAAERKDYVDKGNLPKRFPPAIKDVPAKAADALLKAYTAAQDEYTRQKQDDKAAALEKDIAPLKAGTKPSARIGDLPERLQADIDKGKAACDAASKLTDKRLLAAIDAELEAVRKQLGLPAKAKQDLLDSMATERDLFEKSRMMPFSPRLRAAAMQYAKSLRLDERPAELAYDKAINFLLTAKNDSAAALLADEKNRVLKPKTLGRFNIIGEGNRHNGTIILYSNGTVGGQGVCTWTLNRDNFVTKNTSPGAPAGGHVFAWTVDPNGDDVKGRNVKDGFAYTGKRVDVSK